VGDARSRDRQPRHAAAVARYADLGVHRLVLRPSAFDDPEGLARYLERHAGLAG